MAIKALNSIGGFSVGDTPANIILANGDITTNNITTTGIANLNSISNVYISGGSAGQVIQTDGLGNLSFVTVSTTSLSNGNSNIQILNNANITFSSAGNANIVVITGTGANVTGYLTVAGNGQFNNANLGNLAYANFVNVASNIVTGNLISNALSSTRVPYVGTSNNLTDSTNLIWDNPNQALKIGAGGTEIGGDSGFGYVQTKTGNFSGNINALNANLGNLATANYVNVSSNITVTNLVANTNVDFTGASNVSLGAVGNVKITGGTGGYVLTTDGTGNLTWSATGSPTIIQNGNSNVTVPTGNGNVYINASGAEQWNFDTTGNLTGPAAGSANLGNAVYASFFIGSGNNLSNIQGGNVSGDVSGANHANVADSANSVAGANVSGEVSFAATANSVAGANVSGEVNYAATANAVAGANVSGEVSFAATANSVAGANVSGQVANALVAGTVYTNAQPNITSVGTLSSLDVTGNVSAGNISTTGSGGDITMTGGNITGVNNISANSANYTANVISNNLTVNLELAGNTANFTGNIKALNANLGNLAIANFVQTGQIQNGNSNIAIAANGNITVSATGTANVVSISNVGTNVVGYVTANGNGTFGALYSNTLTSQGGNLVLLAEQAGNTYIQLRPFGDGTVDVGNVRITSLAMPNASTDAATKQYVDDVAQGLNIHDAALAATTNTLASLTGGVITYNNGTSGVGANLVLSGTPTANYLSANVFDGNVTAIVSSRILVKSEANAAFNGIYVVDSATVMTRATDFNSVPEIEPGDFVFVQDGTTYNDSGWVQTSTVTTVGTDPIIFTQFSGAGTYQAGAGLTLTGTVFSVNVDNITTEISGGNVIVKANAQFTTPNIGAATGTSLNLTGNLLAENVNSNAKVTAANIEVTANVLANNFSANSNITSNNATVNLALTGNTANFSGNVILNNLTVNLALAGNTANFTGNINSALNANLGNLVTANYVNVANQVNGNIASFTGNITGANVIANSYVFAPTIVQNAAFYDTRIELSSSAGIIQANAAGNVTQFLPGGSMRLPSAGASDIIGGGYDGSKLTLNDTGAILSQSRGANVKIQVGTGGTIANTWDFNNNGNTIFPAAGTANLGNVATANTVSVTNVNVGNSIITSQTTTTLSTGANQTIATFTVTGTSVVGVEFFVKGVEAAGLKYSVAMVQAVTDGADVDYAIYGGVRLGDTTGALAVNMTSAGGNTNINLQVTPASSNSTVWTTQIRLV